jgi:hypothetical protein
MPGLSQCNSGVPMMKPVSPIRNKHEKIAGRRAAGALGRREPVMVECAKRRFVCRRALNESSARASDEIRM